MRLSAALIVRDEAAVLQACLDSIAGVADEAVVVDTGSVDSTVAIADAAGARVFHEPWRGDFSRARNVALDHARGEWILYIDADERLKPVSRAEVERVLADPETVAYKLLLHPFEHSTPYREYRLWRNDPRIRFAGVIHEKVMPSIHRVAEADGLRIAQCDLALDHVGYEGDQAHKHRRNLPMLREQLRAEPDNVFNWRHLGRVLEGLGDIEGAENALQRAVGVTRAEAQPGLHGSLAFADLVRVRHGSGADVAALLAEALERYPGNWLLVWIAARAAIDGGRHEEALASLDRLLAVDVAALPDTGAGVAYDERLFGVFAHASRGLCLFSLGRYAEAADAYAEAERLEPANPEHAIKGRLARSRSVRS